MSDLSNENERRMFPIVAAFHHKVWQQVCAKFTQKNNVLVKYASSYFYNK